MARLIFPGDHSKKTENATAFMRGVELRAKLFKLIDGNAPAQAQAVTFVFKRFGDEMPEAVIVEGEQA